MASTYIKMQYSVSSFARIMRCNFVTDKWLVSAILLSKHRGVSLTTKYQEEWGGGGGGGGGICSGLNANAIFSSLFLHHSSRQRNRQCAVEALQPIMSSQLSCVYLSLAVISKMRICRRRIIDFKPPGLILSIQWCR